MRIRCVISNLQSGGETSMYDPNLRQFVYFLIAEGIVKDVDWIAQTLTPTLDKGGLLQNLECPSFDYNGAMEVVDREPWNTKSLGDLQFYGGSGQDDVITLEGFLKKHAWKIAMKCPACSSFKEFSSLLYCLNCDV